MWMYCLPATLKNGLHPLISVDHGCQVYLKHQEWIYTL